MSSSSQAPLDSSFITTGLIVVSALFPLLSLFALYLRYRARRVSRQPFFADDYWILAAWLTTVPVSINIWVFAHIIGINHYTHGMLSGITHSLMAIFISSVIVQVPLSVVKISILLFYKRIFIFRWFQIVLWVSTFFVASWGIIFFFLLIFESDPVQSLWTGKGHYRYDPLPLGYAQVGTSIALDVAVLCLPIPVISTLHMVGKRKVAITMIFWLGAFCCVAAIIRLVFLKEALSKVLISLSNISLQWKNFIFQVIEPNCSIIAACLPTYGPLFAKGRAPESLIRSFRSVFSSRSNDSRNAATSQPKSSEVGGASHNTSTSDVELRLHPSQAAGRDWSTHSYQSRTVTSIERFSEPEEPDAEPRNYPNRSINVTTAIGVTRD